MDGDFFLKLLVPLLGVGPVIVFVLGVIRLKKGSGTVLSSVISLIAGIMFTCIYTALSIVLGIVALVCIGLIQVDGIESGLVMGILIEVLSLFLLLVSAGIVIIGICGLIEAKRNNINYKSLKFENADNDYTKSVYGNKKGSGSEDGNVEQSNQEKHDSPDSEYQIF